jgi:hypothetical protein
MVTLQFATMICLKSAEQWLAVDGFASSWAAFRARSAAKL